MLIDLNYYNEGCMYTNFINTKLTEDDKQYITDNYIKSVYTTSDKQNKKLLLL